MSLYTEHPHHQASVMNAVSLRDECNGNSSGFDAGTLSQSEQMEAHLEDVQMTADNKPIPSLSLNDQFNQAHFDVTGCCIVEMNDGTWIGASLSAQKKPKRKKVKPAGFVHEIITMTGG